MTRGQIKEFCGHATDEKRKRMCFPGIEVDGITAARHDVVTDWDQNSLFVIHAGTNDIKPDRTEELTEKYRRLIQQFKKKIQTT